MFKHVIIAVTCGNLLFCGAAMAQAAGSSSGPAAGKPVEPSTAVQKQEGRSAEEMKAGGVNSSAGAPGVEAKPGSQSGALPKSNMNSDEKYK